MGSECDRQDHQPAETNLKCTVCHQPIDNLRIQTFLEFRKTLPTTCAEHSGENKNIAFMAFGHKTGGEPVIVNMNSSQSRETLRQAQRAFRRAR